MLQKSLAFLILLFAFSCAPDDAECTSSADCGALDDICDGCDAIPTEFCQDASCVAIPPVEFTIRGDVSIDRDIDDQSASFVHTIFDAFGHSCDDLDNVYAAGFKNVQGGSFHQDVVLGRAAQSDILIEVRAYSESDGGGELLGRGCVGPVAVSSDLTLESPILVAP